MSRILYITDKFGISQGYEPAFTKLLNKNGIKRQQVTAAHIYNLVSTPLIRKGNETTWKFNPEKTQDIEAAFRQRISAIKPSLVVVSCPAVIGVLAGWDRRVATIDKMRGGVYHYGDCVCIIVQPITAIHRQLDSRLIKSDDGDEEDTQNPYRVPHGEWTLQQDWSKVGRYFHGKQRIIPKFEYAVCRTVDDLEAAERFANGCVLLSKDIETGCWPAQITCDGFAGLHESGTVRAYVIPFYDEYAESGTFWKTAEDHERAYQTMQRINALDIPKTMQNGFYDCSYYIRDRAPVKNYVLDSMYMWYSMYQELPKTLDFISSVLLDDYQYWKDDIKGDKEESGFTDKAPSMERYWRYNALDCRNTLFNTLYLLRLFSADSQGAARARTNYNDTFLRMLSGLQMSMRGVRADFSRRETHRRQLESERDKAVDTFRYMIDDPEFNHNSPDQKCSLLYDVLGIKPRNARGRFIKNGEHGRSSGAMALKLAKSDHPLFRYIIERLEACMVPDKQISNVCDMKLFTDRFRTAFNAAGTETMRFSSKKSNFWDGGNAQNIRKTMRDWLVADEGNVLLDVDYSQSDDVFIAYESQDSGKIEVVESGLDAHAVNGELFFKRPYEWIVAGKIAEDPEVVDPITGIRQLSKKIVHGTNFQMAAFTLYVQMGRESTVAAALLLGHKDADSWPQEKLVYICGQFMLAYRKKYPRLTNKEWYKEIADEVKTGIVTNCFGLSRRFLGNPNDNGTQREATAFKGQSATASNMNRVMYETDWGFLPEAFRDGPNPDYKDRPRRMTLESHGFRYHLQVHDNFVAQLQLNHPKWKEAAMELLYVMNRPVIIHGRTVRIRAEAELGLHWGKGMTPWDGKDPYDLDRIVPGLRGAKSLKVAA